MKKIIIDEEQWQTRIALTENNILQNVYFWSHQADTLERSFFKGIVTKVLPGIQTAFVDIGKEKSGFLHISEIDRELVIDRMTRTFGALEETDKKKRQKSQQAPDIGKIFKEGEEILVQVSKEPVHHKGAKLTTCFTLPGRLLVLMPNIPRIGISKKINERDEQARLKEIVLKHIPEEMGAIIRTCAQGAQEKEITRDLNFLVKTWHTIKKTESTSSPLAKLHEDISLPFQVIRDHLDDDVEKIITNNADHQKRLVNFVKEIAPDYTQIVETYIDKTPIFEHFNIEAQIEAALKKKVELKSGGSIVVEATEAMTVIDVNTGRYLGKNDLEDTILKTNFEAAQEIVRQLKLRNIGGLIVIDFIDMAIPSNRQRMFRSFEKTLREQDKFQSVLLKISEFGLVQMTRKRSGKTLEQSLTDTCSLCHGMGRTPSVRVQTYTLLRTLKQTLQTKSSQGDISISLNPHVFEYLTNVEYKTFLSFEKKFNCKITLVADHRLSIPTFKISKT